MIKHFGFIIVLLCSGGAFCAPTFSVAVNIGGTASSVEASHIDSSTFYINVDGSKWIGDVSFGISGEVAFNEYLGAGLGVSYEKRGGILTGGLWLGNIKLASGEWELDYRYLQIPVYFKAMLPLMIPGSLFCTIGPELGIKLQSEATVRSNNYSNTTVIDTVSEPLDFGLSGTIGYEVPLGWFCGLRIYGGYYYGLIDVYNKSNPPNSDADIFNRAFKYGLSFYVNINSSRKR
jgi:Outer membrane protein beta-barrel domain